jgi:hypothetical protein
MESESVLMGDWLPLLNFIVQCCLLVGLIWYTWETYKMRKASQRSADAAIDAAKASVQQALAAEENLRLLKESYEERIGQGPQIVREAIQRAKSLIVYWKTQAAHIAQPPHGNPDPAPLANSGLLNVLSHARQIPGCATLLIDADAAMTNAKSELEKAYATAKKQTFPLMPSRAPEYLKQADELLEKALQIVPQST